MNRLPDNLKTPAYIYSGKALKAQYLKLRNALPEEMAIYYSLKANAHPALLKTLNSLSCRADVASLKELNSAMEAGFEGKFIEFTGPAKSTEALTVAVRNNVHPIIAESLSEIQKINEIAINLGKKAAVSLRINPLERTDTDFSQFGIEESQCQSILTFIESCPNIDLIGLHVFTQSQLLNTDKLLKNFSIAFEALQRVASHCRKPLRIVNIGGGFGIPYFENTSELDLSPVKSFFEKILSRMKMNSILSEAELCIETGRFLAGPSGHFIAKVMDKKTSGKKTIVILDGGFSQNMAICGFGQLIRKNYQIEVLNKASDVLEVVTLAGPSCYSQDISGMDVSLPVLVAGDHVLFKNCGSYGQSYSPADFLGLPRAEEYFMDDQ